MHRLRGAALPLALTVCSAATPAVAADWEWNIAPYLWASAASADVAVNGDPVLGGDASFSEIVDKTELAGMLHFEGRAGRAGFFADAVYLSLSDDQTTQGTGPVIPAGTSVHSELETGCYEAGGFYRLTGDERPLDLLVGGRVLDVEQEHDIALPPPTNATTAVNTSESHLDAFAGLRFSRAFGSRMDFAIRGDVGAGDTEFTWHAIGSLGVRLGQSDKYSLRFGWKHLASEFEETASSGARVETDLVFSGPAIGFGIKL